MELRGRSGSASGECEILEIFAINGNQHTKLEHSGVRDLLGVKQAPVSLSKP